MASVGVHFTAANPPQRSSVVKSRSDISAFCHMPSMRMARVGVMTWLASKVKRLVVSLANFESGVVEAGLGRCLLGDDIDGAAGRAAAVYRGRRSFEDLDLLRKEIFPDVDGGIADAVNKDIITRIEAADEKAIAERVAALTGSDSHAGGVAARLP